MFELIECDRRYKFVLLRCLECNDGNAFDNEDFEVLEENKVVVKKGIKITCPKCGSIQPPDKRLIPLEHQTVKYVFNASKTRQSKGLFSCLLDGMSNMTREEALSISNTIAAFNTDFPDSCD